jgi:hypothetical protein
MEHGFIDYEHQAAFWSLVMRYKNNPYQVAVKFCGLRPDYVVGDVVQFQQDLQRATGADIKSQPKCAVTAQSEEEVAAQEASKFPGAEDTDGSMVERRRYRNFVNVDGLSAIVKTVITPKTVRLADRMMRSFVRDLTLRVVHVAIFQQATLVNGEFVRKALGINSS